MCCCSKVQDKVLGLAHNVFERPVLGVACAFVRFTTVVAGIEHYYWPAIALLCRRPGQVTTVPGCRSKQPC